MTTPAVTLRSSPVMEAEPPEARNTQAAATSSAVTMRRSGDLTSHSALACSARRRLALYRGPARCRGDPAGRGLEGDHLLDPGSGDRAGADRVHPDAVGPE